MGTSFHSAALVGGRDVALSQRFENSSRFKLLFLLHVFGGSAQCGLSVSELSVSPSGLGLVFMSLFFLI